MSVLDQVLASRLLHERRIFARKTPYMGPVGAPLCHWSLGAHVVTHKIHIIVYPPWSHLTPSYTPMALVLGTWCKLSMGDIICGPPLPPTYFPAYCQTYTFKLTNESDVYWSRDYSHQWKHVPLFCSYEPAPHDFVLFTFIICVSLVPVPGQLKLEFKALD